MADLSRRSALSGGVALLAGASGTSLEKAAAGGADPAPSLIIAKADRSIGDNTHFWCATGFSPAELLLTAEMRQALTYFGAVPNGGISFVRESITCLTS
jgi:hypothetical protein